jgi:hypothetical protein
MSALGQTHPAEHCMVNGPAGAPLGNLPAGQNGLLLGTNGEASYKVDSILQRAL